MSQIVNNIIGSVLSTIWVIDRLLRLFYAKEALYKLPWYEEGHDSLTQQASFIHTVA